MSPPAGDDPVPDESVSLQCVYCETRGPSVSNRKGRGAVPMCDRCDDRIARRMRQMEVVVPDTVGDRPRGQLPGYGDPDSIRWGEMDSVGEETARALVDAGLRTVEDVQSCTVERLLRVEPVERSLARLIIDLAAQDPDKFPTGGGSTSVGDEGSDDDGLDDQFD